MGARASTITKTIKPGQAHTPEAGSRYLLCGQYHDQLFAGWAGQLSKFGQ
jgi:hypothetical protein